MILKINEIENSFWKRSQCRKIFHLDRKEMKNIYIYMRKKGFVTPLFLVVVGV